MLKATWLKLASLLLKDFECDELLNPDDLNGRINGQKDRQRSTTVVYWYTSRSLELAKVFGDEYFLIKRLQRISNLEIQRERIPE